MNQKKLNKIKNNIKALSDLKTNWDQEGARPISPQVIKGMLKFANDIIPLVPGLPRPYIMPGGWETDDGCHAQFEWYIKDKDISLELEFEDEITIHYLKWDKESVEETVEEKIFKTTSKDGKDRCIGLLQWLKSKT